MSALWAVVAAAERQVVGPAGSCHVVDAAERRVVGPAGGCHVVEPRKLSGLLSRCRHAKRGLSGTPPKP